MLFILYTLDITPPPPISYVLNKVGTEIERAELQYERSTGIKKTFSNGLVDEPKKENDKVVVVFQHSTSWYRYITSSVNILLDL